MALEPRHDQASYTPDGHIVIGGGATPSAEPTWAMTNDIEELLRDLPDPAPTPIPVAPPKPKGPSRAAKIRVSLAAMQEDFQASATELIQKSVADVTVASAAAGTVIKRNTVKTLAEGGRQFEASAKEMPRLGAALYDESTTLLGHFWYFLRQPVWVPRKNKPPRKQSRGTLFLIDVARFGGTFAVIFGALFVALNYQSFWQIAAAELDPLSNVAALSAAGQDLQAHLEGADTNTRDDLSVVPTVGPPDNRLIVPKLDLNVPIVNPPIDALLNEDWTKLEEDIQTGLQDGVVHYPGTASPGQAGNFFLTGHSSYYAWSPGNYKSVFARLSELNVGDEYWVYYGGDKHRYIVTGKTEVKPSDVHVLDQPTDQRLATLMTCTPIGTTLRRLIVAATEIDPITGAPLAVGEHATQEALPKVKVEVLPI